MTFIYNADTYGKQFKQQVTKLEKAEATTREILRDLSREVLFILHEHENIFYVNQLIKAKTTSINRKALLLFLQHFTGFTFDENLGEFTKKNKSQYDEKKAACLDFLTDPHNNFWTWADREIEVKKSEFDPKKITKYVENQIKKATEAGFSQRDVLSAVFDAGIDLELIKEVLEAQAEAQW